MKLLVGVLYMLSFAVVLWFDTNKSPVPKCCVSRNTASGDACVYAFCVIHHKYVLHMLAEKKICYWE